LGRRFSLPLPGVAPSLRFGGRSQVRLTLHRARRNVADVMNAQFRAALAERYRLERELGRGGMATVYLTHDLKHDRPVALKVLHPDIAAALGPERFQQEIMVAARLQHPHILSVLDSGEAAGELWFTMPFARLCPPPRDHPSRYKA
jgi:serine/threonine protein kinase